MVIKTNKYVLHEDYAEIIVDSPTYGRFFFQIDIDDLDRCLEYQWGIMRVQLSEASPVYYYANNNKTGMLHRFIMNAPKTMVVDHVDRNTFNTRKRNLRLTDHKGNGKNTKLSRRNKSGAKGVIWFPYKGYNKWKAYIRVNYKNINLGFFDTKEEAIAARKAAEEKYFGEYSAGDVNLSN